MGEAMTVDPDPFIADVGRALTSGPVMCRLTIDAALASMHRDPAALSLADSLGDAEPWSVLADAIRTTLREPDTRTLIASDLPLT